MVLSWAMNKVAVIVGILVIIILGLVFYIFSNKNLVNNSANATISGTFDFNGPIPQGATLSIAERELGKGSFNTVVNNLGAEDQSGWTWTGAKSNTNYEIQAYLKQGNQTLATSETIAVTAPATEEVLVINYSPNNTNSSPAPSASTSTVATPAPTAAAPTQARVTGSVTVNGYIPAGSLVTIQQKSPNQDFAQVGTSFTASNGETWVWREASSGVTYQIRALLTDSSGNSLGTSNPVVVTAPAANTALVINSSAKAPQPTNGSISGSINFNGATPSNSSIVILATQAGTNNYQVVVNGVQAANGSTWLWNNAQVGTNYQIIAVLKQQNSNGTQADVATSQSLIVSAPATNQVLTLNSNISLPAPNNGQITMNCNSKNQSQNNWSVTVNFPSVAGAQTYWYQIGTSAGGSSLVNTTQGASNTPAQQLNATFNDSVTYYAQYAYSFVPNASWTNGFSAFSNSSSFKCPQ